MTSGTGERIHIDRTGMVGIALPVAEAFPLFNAEGEKRWVPGWDPFFVYPTVPGAGEGVVFQTIKNAAGTATWVQSRHKPNRGVASFVCLVPDHHVAMVDVAVISINEGRSRASVRYRMTSLSSDADEFVRAFGESFDDLMTGWEEAIQRHVVEGVPLAGA